MEDINELKKAAEHLAYEMWMLDYCYKQLTEIDANKGEANKALHDVFLDAFVIHSENLFHFYYYGEKDTDIVVQHFLSCDSLTDFRKKRVKKKEIDEIADITAKRNKQVAHLTWERVDKYKGEEKCWSYKEIYLVLKKNQEIFINRLCAEVTPVLKEKIDLFSSPEYSRNFLLCRGFTGPAAPGSTAVV